MRIVKRVHIQSVGQAAIGPSITRAEALADLLDTVGGGVDVIEAVRVAANAAWDAGRSFTVRSAEAGVEVAVEFAVVPEKCILCGRMFTGPSCPNEGCKPLE
jgi:hypothetical protein